jgi:hypothetical protein
MFKAIAYKEWLKIRWTFLAMVVVCVGITVNIALDLSHLMTMERPVNVWSYVIQMQYPFYGSLRYIPLLIGCAIAVAQLVPEVLQSRLKLSLHLPLRENQVLLWMVAYGGCMVAGLLLLELLASVVVALAFFPREVMQSMVLTMAPWFLAGIVGYFITTAIVVEPRWLRRVFLILLGYMFLDALVLRVAIKAYSPSLVWFTLLTILAIPGIVLSGHRFRKGVR